jgi:hypothetical protein
MGLVSRRHDRPMHGQDADMTTALVTSDHLTDLMTCSGGWAAAAALLDPIPSHSKPVAATTTP